MKKFLIACSEAQSLRNFRGRLIETIRERGHRVVALAPAFSEAEQRWCDERGVETDLHHVDNQSLNPIGDALALSHLIGVVRHHRPDVVMGYTHKPALYTAFAARIAGVKHIAMMVTGLGYGFAPEASAKGRLVKTITHMLFRTGCAVCDKVIFHNKDNRDFFLSSGILKCAAKAVVVGGSGVDLQRFPPRPLPASARGELTFLSVGRIVRYKGILEYARAAAALRDQFPNARFVLAGYWDANPLSYAPDEWAFTKANLDYVGKSEDVGALLAECDVYVLPSYGEGMPRTVLEAMATGRAIITTETFGCRDTVDEGVNGFLVPVKSWEPLRDAMRHFLTEPALRETMGAASLGMARDRFDVETVNRDMIAALEL